MTVTLEQAYTRTAISETDEKNNTDKSHIFLIRFTPCTACTNSDVQGDPTPEDCQGCLKKPLDFCNYTVDIKHLDRGKFSIREKESTETQDTETKVVTNISNEEQENPKQENLTLEKWVIEQLNGESSLVEGGLRGHFGKDFQEKLTQTLQKMTNNGTVTKNDQGKYQLNDNFSKQATEIVIENGSKTKLNEEQEIIAESSFITAETLLKNQMTLDPTTFTRIAEEYSAQDLGTPLTDTRLQKVNTSVIKHQKRYRVSFLEIRKNELVRKEIEFDTLDEATAFTKGLSHFTLVPIVAT